MDLKVFSISGLISSIRGHLFGEVNRGD